MEKWLFFAAMSIALTSILLSTPLHSFVIAVSSNSYLEYVAYASWNDEDNRNDGYVWIYPLIDKTNIRLWYTTSTTTPIQINLLAATWMNVPAGKPLSYGPLTEDQYFFKLWADKPVTWELNTIDYYNWKESSKFVTSGGFCPYLGKVFYFHADNEPNEAIFVINPSLGSGSGPVSIYKWTGTSWNYCDGTSNISPDLFWKCPSPVGQNTFYKIEASNPVLVYEGRLFGQEMATGVTAEGDTVGSVVYCAVPYDEAVYLYGGQTYVHVMGVTGATYAIYGNIGTSWFTVTTDSVTPGSCTTHYLGLNMDIVYKITTKSSTQKIFVQYITESNDAASGGGEMIPGIDGGDTKNPGREFILYFDAGWQKYIDILTPDPGTSVSINGPNSAGFTSIVNDEVFHWAPGSGNEGLYTITSTKPVYVMILSILGDEQGYFVYQPYYVLTAPPVGGFAFPIDMPKPDLSVPYIGLASTIIVATLATAIYAKHFKRKKEK